MKGHQLRTVGVAIFLSPFVFAVFGFMVCRVYSPFCLAAPFVLVLFWPATIVGAIVFLIGARGSRKEQERLSHKLDIEYSASAKPERMVQPSHSESQRMKEYGILFDGERYSFGEYRYEKLADAINYAKRQNKPSI